MHSVHQDQWESGWLLVCALLCKENVTLLVLMVGLYLVVFERDWLWGLSTAVLGFIWALVVTLRVISSLKPPSDRVAICTQLNAFCLKGETLPSKLAFLMRDPFLLFRGMFDRAGLLALFQREGPALSAIEVDRGAIRPCG